MAFCYLILYFNTHTAKFAHGFINCIVLMSILILLRKFSSIYRIVVTNKNREALLVSATFILYLVHFKVLDFMVQIGGHISFVSWAITTIFVTIIVGLIMKYLMHFLKI